MLDHSVEQFLEELARRGSWIGGGSAAALSAALSAALLEKLVVEAQVARRLQRIRRQCVGLIAHDARAFSHVIAATRGGNRRAFSRSLKQATEVPGRVFAHAQTIQAACRRAQRSVKPRLQSDLRCAMALALAAGESARTLVHTNLSWLGEARYATRMRQRLHAGGRRRVQERGRSSARSPRRR